MRKTIFPVIIGLVSIVIIVSASMAFYTSMPKPLSEHETVVANTIIKATLGSDVTVLLTPRCIETKHQKTYSLSIIDIAKRAQWVNQELDYSLWVFEYEGHPLAYMKIWGPYRNELYIEVSRGAMTTLECTVVDTTFTFELTTQDPPQSGFWYGFIEVTP